MRAYALRLPFFFRLLHPLSIEYRFPVANRLQTPKKICLWCIIKLWSWESYQTLFSSPTFFPPLSTHRNRTTSTPAFCVYVFFFFAQLFHSIPFVATQESNHFHNHSPCIRKNTNPTIAKIPCSPEGCKKCCHITCFQGLMVLQKHSFVCQNFKM
jgi:hypothetical protein